MARQQPQVPQPALLRYKSHISPKNVKNTCLLSSFYNYSLNNSTKPLLRRIQMDNKKFEQLIDLIINENEEQARALFHDIVVEKSREIYESMMEDEMDEDGMGGQVGQMMDEISAEQEGMAEAEGEEIDFDDDGDEEIVDISADDGEDDFEEEDLEDRVTDLEDKLDELMAEFEEIMADNDSEESDAEFDDQAEEEGEDLTHDMEQDRDEEMDEEAMMEAIALKKVSVTHGDNGQNTKSTNLNNSGQAGMDSKPVKFSGSAEANPTGPKKPSNAYAKGETQVKDATKWKNAPAQNNADLEGTPKPVTKDGATGTKSPVAESRKTSTKRRI